MMTLTEAATVLDARLQGSDIRFDGVSTDTRTLEPGNLFIALRGERYDGHGFVLAAARAGAAAAMVDAAGIPPEGELPLLIVADTRLALGRLAAHWRKRFSLPLVALTGSSGKTTVKEMLAAILREAASARVGRVEAADAVLATRGNLNNDIGMPLMLLELGSRHHYAVIEMGMNHAGEIRYLTQLAEPDVALVTNAGRAHIEFLGSELAIARAKGEIFEGLQPQGTAVINADDPHAPLWREMTTGRRCVDFGLEHHAAVTGSYELRELDSEIVLKTPRGDATARLNAPGVHNVRNALAASAAAIALDIPVSTIAAGLEHFSGIKGRLQRKTGMKGSVVLDDTYNANPESVRAAIAVLAQAAGPKIFVFGDMGELGPDAPLMHTELGSCAREGRIDRVLTLGEHAALTAEAFGAGGQHYGRIEDLVSDLKNALAPDATVLIKGSRFMKMERVVDAIATDERESTGEKGAGGNR